MFKAWYLACFLIFNFAQIYSQTWSPPVDVSDPLANALPVGPPSLGVDSNGNAIAVWASQESGQSLIKASRFDAVTQVWSFPVTIGSDSSNDAHIAVTADGKAIAVWTNSNPLETTYSNMFDGSVWLGEQVVDTNPIYQTQFYPKVAIDEQGQAFSVWQVQAGNLARVIRSATFSFASNTWEAATNISTDYGLGNSFVGSPIISANATGTAVAGWIYQDTVTSNYKLQNNRYSGGAWLASGSEENIVTSNTDNVQFAPMALVVAPNGNALTIWPQYNGTQVPTQDYTIMSSIRNFGTSTWSSPVQISAVGNADISKIFVDLDVNASNNALGVWSFEDDTVLPNQVLIQAAAFPNLVWSGLATTISDPNLISLLGSVAIDNAGDGYATWTTSDFATFFSIQASKYSQSTNTWETPQTISDPGLFATGPNQISNISSDAKGDFFAIWFHIEPNIIMQSSHITIQNPAPTPPLPPSDFIGVIKKNKFLNKTECILKAKWGASASSNIISYRIYKNGRVVVTVLATSPLVFETYLHHCSAKGYEIAAVSSDNLESSHIKLRLIHE